ncbi:MAG: NAD(P)/FAD-dependent oxidoreductase [Rickettsiales bacterium]|jgi:predicted Rossmann fold flavoprotein|nr:NAD(P)/FAD-dependent oxidoreductase [Rickettsiales bacterium]
MTKNYDVIIIGAGAAGLCAARAALRLGRKVLILDMGAVAARKVAVSGGGRCNFTNLAAIDSLRYFGENTDFAKSILARVKPQDILDWAASHGIVAEEKSPGQFFSADGAGAIVDALMKDAKGADFIFNVKVKNVDKESGKWSVQSGNNEYSSQSLIIATGGVSYPTLGVSDFGMKIAKKFGHKIVPPRPGLCVLKTDAFPPELAGISLPVVINGIADSLLFTHSGIGGPAAYRASLGDISNIVIDFIPGASAAELLRKTKKENGRCAPAAVFALPQKFAKWVVMGADKNLADYKDSELTELGDKINNFRIESAERVGFANAEVMAGGVSTDQISSKTLESKLCPGLYFAGEVLDITGDLGGFNLHFAFASGLIAGDGIITINWNE